MPFMELMRMFITEPFSGMEKVVRQQNEQHNLVF